MRPNDQVERRADTTPAQKENMNRHVRSNAMLGHNLGTMGTTSNAGAARNRDQP